MTHDWSEKLVMLVRNATGVDLNGNPGEFDSALYQLISEAYKQSKDKEDIAILCILLRLHEAIQGKVDLLAFADHVINHPYVSPIWTPPRPRIEV